ncbi:MAG: transporter substrate-binding domain-containing protein [Candidatus Thiodiazotropha endolucinida]|nr:transporter substrate-binding domain-containing protein [Candidatus Thiodiazotropha taylori]MCW4313533.1 transporter substrate-binding domain-containing protein [Candidatus Thiodiazotropha taylori]
MNIGKILLAIAISVTSMEGSAKNLKICVDDEWYPYTYVQDAQAVGIHVAVLKKALESTGYTADMVPLPWKRCLKQGKEGIVDAVMSASYKDSRVIFFHYPEDAGNAKYPESRIGQAEYVLVTFNSTTYEFDGNWETIPQPVVVGGLGSSIIDDLKELGLEVLDGDSKIAGLRLLMKERAASMVLTPIRAKIFNTSGEFKGKLKIHKIPLKSKSYHIIFSKKGSATQKDRQAIWSSLPRVRSDEKFMLELLKQYEH